MLLVASNSQRAADQLQRDLLQIEGSSPVVVTNVNVLKDQPVARTIIAVYEDPDIWFRSRMNEGLMTSSGSYYDFWTKMMELSKRRQVIWVEYGDSYPEDVNRALCMLGYDFPGVVPGTDIPTERMHSTPSAKIIYNQLTEKKEEQLCDD